MLISNKPNAVAVKFVKYKKKNRKLKQWIYPKTYIFKVNPKQIERVKVNDILFVRYYKNGNRIPVKVVEILTLPLKEARKHKPILADK